MISGEVVPSTLPGHNTGEYPNIIRCLCQKLEESEARVKQLERKYKRKCNMFDELEELMKVLEAKCTENALEVKLQKHKLIQQRVVMEEYFIGQKLKQEHMKALTWPYPHFAREVWVLRSHQENLVILTKPFVGKIVKVAEKAGIISGLPQNEATINDHELATAFYEALITSVAESPDLLLKFLRLMENDLDEKVPTFKKMLKDIA